jgi:hypothetical protein
LGLGRFFSFLIPYTVGRTPWTGDQPVARPLPTHRKHKHRINADIHASNGIRIHDPSVWACEDGSYLRLRGHCDWHLIIFGSLHIDRPSDRRLLAKLVPTFVDRGVSRGHRNGSPRPLISVFKTGATTFSFKFACGLQATEFSLVFFF